MKARGRDAKLVLHIAIDAYRAAELVLDVALDSRHGLDDELDRLLLSCRNNDVSTWRHL